MIIDSFTMNRYNQLLFEGLRTNFDTKGKWQWVRLSAKRTFYNGNGNHRAHLEIIDDDHNAHIQIDEVRFGDKGPPPNPTPDAVPASVRPEADATFAAITKRFNEALSKAPGLERVLAITDGSGEDSYLHIRGSYTGKGEDLPRRFLTALGGEEGTAAPSDGSGRDNLASRMVDRDNPLTARVQVNRLWHHLFGTGLAATVDNLGVLGVAPSHPKLLDHLAVTFMQDDAWSNKTMIKRIVMSRAYQRTSDKLDSQAEQQDPNNLLLHRQNIRRMTAETIRDSVLAVAGSLNDKMYGPPVNIYLTEQMQGRGRPSSGPLDGQGRRSIYNSVKRNFLSPMMLTFDAPIPFTAIGRRNVTNVPVQSLTMLNDPFIHDQSNKWAQRLIKDGRAQPAERIDAIFFTATGRPATTAQRDAAIAYLNEQAKQLNLSDEQLMGHAELWQQICHVAFNLKGFIFIR